jgi:hypothetical protein
MVAIVVPENYGYVLHCVDVRKTIHNMKLIEMPVPSSLLPWELFQCLASFMEAS